MITTKEINMFKNGYFETYILGNEEIIIQSKNTGHFWHIEKVNKRIVVSHKHYINQIYHREKWKIKSMLEAKKRIIGHDIFQLNNRKPIEAELLEYIVNFYM